MITDEDRLDLCNKSFTVLEELKKTAKDKRMKLLLEDLEEQYRKLLFDKLSLEELLSLVDETEYSLGSYLPSEFIKLLWDYRHIIEVELQKQSIKEDVQTLSDILDTLKTLSYEQKITLITQLLKLERNMKV